MATASASSDGGGDGDQKVSSIECTICLEKYKSGFKIPKMLKCGHSFCDRCVKSMIQNNRLKCPKCRKIFPIASDGYPPTNFDLLSVVDEEENRAKSFKHTCSDCSIKLTVDTTFVCKGDHNGMICFDCGSKHSDHGGIEPLKLLLNQPTLDGNLKRLKEARERYNALEADIEHRRTVIESCINRLTSTKEHITRVMDDVRSEMDKITLETTDQSGVLFGAGTVSNANISQPAIRLGLGPPPTGASYVLMQDPNSMFRVPPPLAFSTQQPPPPGNPRAGQLVLLAPPPCGVGFDFSRQPPPPIMMQPCHPMLQAPPGARIAAPHFGPPPTAYVWTPAPVGQQQQPQPQTSVSPSTSQHGSQHSGGNRNGVNPIDRNTDLLQRMDTFLRGDSGGRNGTSGGGNNVA